MPTLSDELSQQPQALRDLAAFYQNDPALLDLPGADRSGLWVLAGMGASYHAAWIAALHLNQLGIPAAAVEAVDLLNYAAALRAARPLIYISQSGASGEIPALLELLGGSPSLVAVTNQPGSLLARHAARVLPLAAGEEQWIAGKTYLNMLALLWLLARRQAGAGLRTDLAALHDLSERAAAILAHPERSTSPLSGLSGSPAHPLLFLGHGPHAATAREAAMTLAEWPKVTALHSGTGAFRHGFIETIRPGSRVVAFASPGRAAAGLPAAGLPATGIPAASTRALAAELAGYGASVLLIENGVVRAPSDPPPAETGPDEFLSPLLDILPIQLFADHLAGNPPPGFRYISKVVKKV